MASDGLVTTMRTERLLVGVQMRYWPMYRMTGVLISAALQIVPLLELNSKRQYTSTCCICWLHLVTTIPPDDLNLIW
jgi:hypothetical protein